MSFLSKFLNRGYGKRESSVEVICIKFIDIVSDVRSDNYQKYSVDLIQLLRIKTIRTFLFKMPGNQETTRLSSVNIVPQICRNVLRQRVERLVETIQATYLYPSKPSSDPFIVSTGARA